MESELARREKPPASAGDRSTALVLRENPHSLSNPFDDYLLKKGQMFLAALQARVRKR